MARSSWTLTTTPTRRNALRCPLTPPQPWRCRAPCMHRTSRGSIHSTKCIFCVFNWVVVVVCGNAGSGAVLPSPDTRGPHRDLNCAPYNVYGGTYIGLVSLGPSLRSPSALASCHPCPPQYNYYKTITARHAGWPHLSLNRAPYNVYCVKHIDLVSLGHAGWPHTVLAVSRERDLGQRQNHLSPQGAVSWYFLFDPASGTTSGCCGP
jgi:hypothetical protein